MKPVGSLRAITDLKPGEHLCWLYETEEEHRAVLTQFLSQGLKRGEKILYVGDSHTAEVILGYLRDAGLEVDPYLVRGQLTILTSDDVYLREGRFDPDRMIALVRTEAERALAEGYPAVRGTGEMTWVMRGLPGSDRLLEYEAKLNISLQDSKCLGLCQYDRRRFDPAMLLNILITHPTVIVGTEVCNNFYYVPPTDSGDHDFPSAVLHSWLANLTSCRRLEEAIWREKELSEKLINSSIDGIFAFDRDCRYIVWNPGMERISGVSKEACLGRCAFDLFPFLKAIGEDQYFYAALEGRTVIAKDRPYTVPETGREGFFEGYYSPLRSESGEIIGGLAIIHDITEHKRTEETLRALYLASLEIQAPLGLQERLNRLLQAARDILHLDRLNILLADPEGRWLQEVASFGAEEPLEAIRIPIGPEGGGLAQAYVTQQPIIWLDSQAPVPEALRLKPSYDRIAAFRSRAFIILPLVVQGQAIGVLGADRKHSRQPLDQATLDLLHLFAAQAAVAIQNAQLFEQVRSGREQLQILSRRLVEVQEIERRHLARELHDEIGQILTGLKLVLEMSTRLPVDAVRASLREARKLVSDLMARVRELSLGLRPAILDDLGLLPALLWHFERYAAQTHVQVVFKHEGLEGRRFRPEIETAVYRIVQEALTNVARHAGVSEATVRIWADQNILGLQIEDQGTGFNSETILATSTASGLTGMRERATLLGGHLIVESAPGAGTRVAAELPLGGRIERRKKKR